MARWTDINGVGDGKVYRAKVIEGGSSTTIEVEWETTRWVEGGTSSTLPLDMVIERLQAGTLCRICHQPGHNIRNCLYSEKKVQEQKPAKKRRSSAKKSVARKQDVSVKPRHVADAQSSCEVSNLTPEELRLVKNWGKDYVPTGSLPPKLAEFRRSRLREYARRRRSGANTSLKRRQVVKRKRDTGGSGCRQCQRPSRKCAHTCGKSRPEIGCRQQAVERNADEETRMAAGALNDASAGGQYRCTACSIPFAKHDQLQSHLSGGRCIVRGRDRADAAETLDWLLDIAEIHG